MGFNETSYGTKPNSSDINYDCDIDLKGQFTIKNLKGAYGLALQLNALIPLLDAAGIDSNEDFLPKIVESITVDTLDSKLMSTLNTAGLLSETTITDKISLCLETGEFLTAANFAVFETYIKTATAALKNKILSLLGSKTSVNSTDVYIIKSFDSQYLSNNVLTTLNAQFVIPDCYLDGSKFSILPTGIASTSNIFTTPPVTEIYVNNIATGVTLPYHWQTSYKAVYDQSLEFSAKAGDIITLKCMSYYQTWDVCNSATFTALAVCGTDGNPLNASLSVWQWLGA